MPVSFTTEKSKSASPGPVRISRPAVPRKPIGWMLNAVASKYRLGPPKIMLLLLCPATKSGRSACEPATLDLERLLERVGVKGYPDWSERMPLTHHPLISVATTPLLVGWGNR